MKNSANKAFTIIELSIVIIAIAFLYFSIKAAAKLINNAESLVAANQADNAWEASEEESVSIPSIALPSSLAENTLIWLDASDADTLTLSGDDVTAWSSKHQVNSNLTLTALPPASSERPKSGQTTLNSRNVLVFDGTDDNFVIDNSSLGFNPDTTDVSIFVVGSIDLVYGDGDASNGVDSTQDLDHFIANQDGSGSGRSLLFMVDGFLDGNWAGGLRADSLDFTQEVYYLIGVVHDDSAGTTDFYLNNDNENFTGTTGSSSDGDIVIAAHKFGPSGAHGARAMLDGNIAEILFFNKALSPSEIGDLQSYINSKWGISFQ